MNINHMKLNFSISTVVIFICAVYYSYTHLFYKQLELITAPQQFILYMVLENIFLISKEDINAVLIKIVIDIPSTNVEWTQKGIDNSMDVMERKTM